ncbi:integrase core domain-containing protein [Saccharothrix syringae]|uniref:Integrase catalytic domain-containing protein n=1 Tax=Saccharothrix syringae TaxID=103733 RepID=A0A5Q0GWU4_SACSY|nr:integrase core domain-containing protein [Saccharothrix syringae]QFZ18449.1 hypothetical protein EKG83_14025 [Saccharothrix syringae]
MGRAGRTWLRHPHRRAGHRRAGGTGPAAAGEPPTGRGRGNPQARHLGTLKTEIGTSVWDTRDDVRRDVFTYPGYYNHDRLHSTLGYRTPHEARVGYRQGLALVS